jgi:hypothetical protein
MKHNLNNRFTLYTNKHNWILLDEQEGKKAKRSFFSNIEQLSRFIGELVVRESLGKAKAKLGDIHSITPSYSSVIDKIVERLEAYIDSIVRDEKSRYRK